MPLFLKHRNETLIEWMDREDCDEELLNNTYSQFTTINKLLSGWKNIYRTKIKPVIQQSSEKKVTILDIGCGGGDIIRFLDNLIKKDGYSAEFTGIDPDLRSIHFLDGKNHQSNILFRNCNSTQLANEDKVFDIVISNHLIHHLSENELQAVCKDAEKLALSIAIFSDIERSDIGFASFGLIAPLLFRNSYIVKDGLISVRKSYRKNELQHALPPGWIVSRKFPFRLLATYQPNAT